MSGPTKRKSRPGRTANPAKGIGKRIAPNLARVNLHLRMNCVLLVAVALATVLEGAL
jgi:hypothetical protein